MDIIKKVAKWGIPLTTVITVLLFSIGVNYYYGFCWQFGIEIQPGELDFISLLMINKYSLLFIYHAFLIYISLEWSKSYSRQTETVIERGERVAKCIEAYGVPGKMFSDALEQFPGKRRDSQEIIDKVVNNIHSILQLLQTKGANQIFTIPREELTAIVGESCGLGELSDIEYKGLLCRIMLISERAKESEGKESIYQYIAEYRQQEKQVKEKYSPSKVEIVVAVLLSIYFIVFIVWSAIYGDAFLSYTIIWGVGTGVFARLINKVKFTDLKVMIAALCILMLLANARLSGDHEARSKTKTKIAITAKDTNEEKGFYLILRTRNGCYLLTTKSDRREVVYIPHSEIRYVRYIR